MKRGIGRPSFVLAALLALLGPGCGDSETPSQEDFDGWTALASSPDVGMNRRHDDIFFLDSNNGWLINVQGETHRTTDGGATWSKISGPIDVNLRTVGFVSTELGWAGNYNLTNNPVPDKSLFETRDSGRTWNNISSRIRGATVAGLCGMRVLSPSVIVAVGRWNGPAVFVKSVNGGQSWTSVDLRPQATGMIDLHFFNESEGVAVGGFGLGASEAEQRASRTVVLGTGDGGATWQTRYLGTHAGEWAWKVHFVDRQVGYVSIEGATAEGAVLKTTDGGVTWQKRMVASGQSFEGIGFVTRDHGWAAAVETLYATTDGGTTWRALDFGTFINRFRVVNGDRVYACGQKVYRWTP